MCADCHRFGPDWVEVEAVGTVFSWTRTWQRFSAEFADAVPYITVLVELPHAGGRRVLGILVGDDSLDPQIGAPVVGRIQAPSDLTSNMPILRWERAS